MTSEEIDALWDFGKPDQSEAKFRSALDRAGNDADQVRTQLARSLGLQRKFVEAQAELDKIAEAKSPVVQVRWNLEQGRVKNSSGDPESARPYFQAALEKADAHSMDFYAVDAAHMLGIVTKGQESLDWNLKAIQMAEASSEKRARNWKGSLLNNTGWTLHEMGRLDEALSLFERALEFRVQQGKEDNIQIARWSVARCLRSLGRTEEALTMQLELLASDKAGYASEEVGECLTMLGRPQEAEPHFARAHSQLSNDPWFVANEPQRLARMKELSGAHSYE